MTAIHMRGLKVEFLELERKTLEAYLPGLDKALSEIPLLDLEKPGNEGIRLFREAAGPALLIPREYSGLGANPLEAIQIHRAIASRSPSLAIAVTMHNFSIATLVEMASSGGLEGLLLEGIAQQRLLVASGFAEGQRGRGILEPTMQARRTAKGIVINGSKKPCSLSRSMDLLTASLKVIDDSKGEDEIAVALIPASAAGIERKKFWGSWILAGAESDEVILKDVAVEDRLVYPLTDRGRMELTQISGFLWFELLISASYLGMASALVERVLLSGKGAAVDRALLGIEVEGAMAALEGLARSMMVNPRGDDELARMLLVRYSVQRAIERASVLAVELLGGMAFVSSSEVSYLFSAARALAFHPPSRTSIAPDLAEYLAGGSFQIK